MSNAEEAQSSRSETIPQHAERREAIRLAAVSLGTPVTLDDKRLAYLSHRALRTLVAQRLQGASRLKTEDGLTGIFTDRVSEDWPLTDRAAATANIAKINFAPTINGDEILTAHPGHATWLAHQAITGLQNLVLLARADYIDTPAMLVGDTNVEMARIAKRVGFTSYETYVTIDEEGKASDVREVLEAPFETVSTRIFSEDVLAFDAMLSRRLEQVATAQ